MRLASHNRFSDLVAHLVWRLKVLCPATGTARIAAVLSRAGVHLGLTTVHPNGSPTREWTDTS